MKSLFAIAVIAATFAFTGCSRHLDKPDSWTDHGRECATIVVVIEGHKYIILDGWYSGGIVHAESCHCKKMKDALKGDYE